MCGRVSACTCVEPSGRRRPTRTRRWAAAAAGRPSISASTAIAAGKPASAASGRGAGDGAGASSVARSGTAGGDCPVASAWPHGGAGTGAPCTTPGGIRSPARPRGEENWRRRTTTHLHEGMERAQKRPRVGPHRAHASGRGRSVKGVARGGQQPKRGSRRRAAHQRHFGHYRAARDPVRGQPKTTRTRGKRGEGPTPARPQCSRGGGRTKRRSGGAVAPTGRRGRRRGRGPAGPTPDTRGHT